MSSNTELIIFATMETIPKSACQKIGFIRKTHGVFGELILEFETEFEESVAESTRFFIEIDGLLVPFFVTEERFRFKSAKTAIIGFDWVENEKYARRLVGNPVYLYLTEIIDVPEKDPLSRLMNYRLQNQKEEEVGVVEGIDDYSGNVVLTVVSEGKEKLVPYSPELLVTVDHEQKILTLQIPEGLFD